MNNQTLIIYDFNIIFEILKEIKNHLSFEIVSINKNKLEKTHLENNYNFLIISKKKIKGIDSQITIDHFPIEISKLIEIINIKFLKKIYNQQSEIDLGNYKINLNSRKIFSKEKYLDLTERESNIIVFLHKLKKPVTISKLQVEVWGHNSKLETHTVETHIYRLRKKIYETFKDNDFIKSSKSGYTIL